MVTTKILDLLKALEKVNISSNPTDDKTEKNSMAVDSFEMHKI